jgi:hypothetical protein
VHQLRVYLDINTTTSPAKRVRSSANSGHLTVLGPAYEKGRMAEQSDATTASELAEVQADAGGQSTDALRQVIVGLTERSPGIFYLLQGADGQLSRCYGA